MYQNGQVTCTRPLARVRQWRMQNGCNLHAACECLQPHEPSRGRHIDEDVGWWVSGRGNECVRACACGCVVVWLCGCVLGRWGRRTLISLGAAGAVRALGSNLRAGRSPSHGACAHCACDCTCPCSSCCALIALRPFQCCSKIRRRLSRPRLHATAVAALVIAARLPPCTAIAAHSGVFAATAASTVLPSGPSGGGEH
jgi:hypothetical protein